MAPVTIHAVRFFHVTPQAIHAICPAPDNRRLALSRADGTIEIWNVGNAPVLLKWIPGNSESSVEALAWVGERLFSAGLHGLVLEHNLTTLSTRKQFAVTSGPAWCMEYNAPEKALAVGTEEGYVCLFRVVSEGLEYWKTLDKQEDRVLCLNWHSSGKYIATGSPDTIRIWDVKTGSPTARMTTGRVERNRETIVWSVALADDKTVISGDSRKVGMTCFWNGNNGTLIDAYHTHKADVLSVVLNKSKKLVLSSGVDPCIMHFEPVLRNDNHVKWVKSVHRWIHSHDVRALAFHPGKIFSGGLDASLAIQDLSARSAIKYMPKPCGQFASIAKQGRLLLLRYANYLELWKLAETNQDIEELPTGSLAKISRNPEKVLTLNTKDGETIRSCHVSPCGTWIAYATPTRTRIYSLENIRGSSPAIKRATIEADSVQVQISHHVAFPCESKLVLATESGDLQLFHLEAHSAKFIDTYNAADIGVRGGVSLVQADKSLILLADFSGSVVVFDWKKKCTFIKSPLYNHAPIAAMSLSPSLESFMIAYANNHVVEVSMKTGRYTKLSKSLALPVEFRKKKHATNGIVQLKSKDKDLIILYDDQRICSIDRNDLFNSQPVRSLRKRPTMNKDDFEDENKQETKMKITKKYENLLYLGTVDDSTLLAIEVRPQTIEDQLPPSLKQKKFGTM